MFWLFLNSNEDINERAILLSIFIAFIVVGMGIGFLEFNNEILNIPTFLFKDDISFSESSNLDTMEGTNFLNTFNSNKLLLEKYTDERLILRNVVVKSIEKGEVKFNLPEEEFDYFYGEYLAYDTDIKEKLLNYNKGDLVDLIISYKDSTIFAKTILFDIQKSKEKGE